MSIPVVVNSIMRRFRLSRRSVLRGPLGEELRISFFKEICCFFFCDRGERGKREEWEGLVGWWWIEYDMI